MKKYLKNLIIIILRGVNMVKKLFSLLILLFFMSVVSPASAAPYDISGVWLLPFQEGTGELIISKTGKQEPYFMAEVVVPAPNFTLRFTAKLQQSPEYVQLGNNISFLNDQTYGPFQFVLMAVGSNHSIVSLRPYQGTCGDNPWFCKIANQRVAAKR